MAMERGIGPFSFALSLAFIRLRDDPMSSARIVVLGRTYVSFCAEVPGMCGRYCSDLRWSDIAKLYDLSMETAPPEF